VELGLGLPTTVPGITGAALVEWARRAEDRGFGSLGVLDRLVHDNYDALFALAAAAAVTSRIRLTTSLLLPGYRGSPAVLAKQLATLDHLSAGRLVLGIGAGGREDDFTAAGAPYAGRGPRLDALLGELREHWSAGRFGPVLRPAGPAVLAGGHTPTAMRRAARLADGWIAGGSSAAAYAELATRMTTIWSDSGRPGRPRLASLAYVSMGPGGADRAADYLGRYYAFLGPRAAKVAAGAVTTPERLRALVADFRAAGCDELILLPCGPDPDEVDRIADAVPQPTVPQHRPNPAPEPVATVGAAGRARVPTEEGT